MEKGGLYDGSGSEWDENEHPRNTAGEFCNKTTYKEQAAFINLNLFAANYKNQTNKQLNKSRKSHEKQIEKHKYKIEHPNEFYKDWQQFSELKQKGCLNQWGKEIRNYRNQIELINKEFERRGKRNGS